MEIKRIFTRIELWLMEKYPTGLFTWSSSEEGSFQAFFEDKDLTIVFSESAELIDVRFFSSEDYENFCAYSWDIDGPYTVYLEEGNFPPAAKEIMESICQISNNAISFVKNL